MNKFALLTAIAVFAMAIPSLACTTAIVSAEASSTGRPLMWKQRDADDPFNTVVYIPAADGHYAYTAVFKVSDTLRRSAYGGSNEKGLAIMNNKSYNLAVGSYDAANGSLMRRALECCATVEEFDAFLRAENPRTCEANFGVIDATGAAAYFEAADSSVTRFDVPAGGWLVRTNYSFSGEENGISGYARYESAYRLMKRHKGKFSPHFLIDRLGRSYYNAVLGYDASRRIFRRHVFDEDFIARPSTASSVCFDGPMLMWAAIGYTPGAYAMPLVSCAELPTCLTEANAVADSLNKVMHPLPRDGAEKYIDFKVARPIWRTVRRYERRAARIGADPAALDALFEEFKKEV